MYYDVLLYKVSLHQTFHYKNNRNFYIQRNKNLSTHKIRNY